MIDPSEKQAWLVKSEPDDWSMEDQVRVGVEPWDGVRNAQAQKNMRSMIVGDPVLFYHSGKAREIVGLCRVHRAEYPDPDDTTGRYCLVDLHAVQTAPTPVSLAEVKADPRFAEIALVRQPRLSVMPIPYMLFEDLCKMAGMDL